MRQILDERAWRIYLGTGARALGYRGIAAVAGASGAPATTVTAGMREAADGEARGPGQAGGAQPGLTQALADLLEDGKRGDPVSEISWSVLSLRDIGRQLARRGSRCRKDAAARMMRAAGYSPQGMSRILEGKQHPGRDRQFRHINAMIRVFR